MSKLLCIYHGNCADGFGAATVVRHALGAEEVEFFAGTHGEPPPDVTGRQVLIVDFSYKRPVLLKMAEIALSITILDHHESAEQDLIDLPGNVEAIFDMERSGAMLAWDYFHECQEPPLLIKHIQDRDLWRFNYPDTKAIQTALFSYEYDFDVWDRLIFGGTVEVEVLRNEGTALHRKLMKDVHELIEAAGHTILLAGHRIPALNAPYFYSSEAGHLMSRYAPFALCYWLDKGYINFSLRSADDGMNVQELAVRFGGGGHAHAAGFRLPLGSDQATQLLESIA